MIEQVQEKTTMDINNPLVIRDLLLEGFAQMCENQHLTPLMEQLLRTMEPPGEVSLQDWKPEPRGWVLATDHLRRALLAMRTVDFGDLGWDHDPCTALFRGGDDGKLEANADRMELFTFGGGGQ